LLHWRGARVSRWGSLEHCWKVRLRWCTE
jgi:hypothetical protein